MLTIQILDEQDVVKKTEQGKNRVDCVYQQAYRQGDHIRISSDVYPVDVVLQVDDALGSSVCFLAGELDYVIPFAEKKTSYSPKTFSGDRHYLYVRKAEAFEVYAYRNQALNVNDRHGDTHLFPHASANVETRGEAVFAARNAIDGVCENRSHGEWPYESWGINQREDAAMKIEFGREIEADRIDLYTRADFPHDNWWERVTFKFSDGTSLVTKLEKSYEPHQIRFEKKKISWVEICELIKADAPSPFPALTQMEVYGKVL